MTVESMTLLKEPPTPCNGSSSRDFVLGEVSDGVLFVGALPCWIRLGLFVELVYLPRQHGLHTIELFAKEANGEQAWLLAEKEIDAPGVADPSWRHPLNLAVPFDLRLEVDRDDLDLLIVVAVDGNPSALRNVFLRPQPPEHPEAYRPTG
jgi:hypothetical protein